MARDITGLRVTGGGRSGRRGRAVEHQARPHQVQMGLLEFPEGGAVAKVAQRQGPALAAGRGQQPGEFLQLL